MNSYSNIASRPSTNSSLPVQIADAHHHHVSTYLRRDTSQSRVAVQNLTSQSFNTQLDYLDHSSSDGVGSDKKRSDRKYFSPEKLARVRERDAFRKRLERLNMSAEKRRDLRSKDRARKAAIRMQKKLSEEQQQSQMEAYNLHHSTHIRQPGASTITREGRRDGQVNSAHFSAAYRPGNGRTNTLQPESRSRMSPSCSTGNFRKISVNSLLN